MENRHSGQFSMTFIERPVGILWEKKSFETASLFFISLLYGMNGVRNSALILYLSKM